MKKSVAVVAINDPESPRTWSGTPLAILEELRKSDRHVSSLSADAPRIYDKTMYGALGLPIYGRGARGFRQYYGPRKKRLENRVSMRRRMDPSVVYVHTDHMWTPFAGMGANDCFFRDSSWSAYSSNQGIGARLQTRIAKSAKDSLERAGHVFATSEWAKRELIAEGARQESVTVVGTGVGSLITPFDEKVDYSNKRTLCIAKVRFHNKGLDLLLKGFRLARERDPELQLDLVVPPGIVALQAGVTVHSALSGPELVHLYRSASLYAMPARYEPWGLVYLEAQLSALPVLGSSSCAFPELCDGGANGFILPQLDPAHIAEALVEAHSNPADLAARGAAALAFSKRFSWKRTVESMLTVIDGQL